MISKMPKAIIVGSSGQDGILLYDILEKTGYELIGLDKGSIRTNQNSCLPSLLDIFDFSSVASIVRSFQPDEIYHLAAFHNSAEDEKIEEVNLWEENYRVNTHSLLNFLECARQFSPHTRLFYAASSHIFGVPQHKFQDETTQANPVTAYGITKAAGMFLCRSYRQRYKIFAAVGILYNHESIYRSQKFISAKIVNSAIRIKRSGQGRLVVGNLGAAVDWGYAPDYVNAMQKILALPVPEDFVIATGEGHTVQEFVEVVFQELGLDWHLFVEEGKDILIRQSPVLIGNAEKLRKRTGWRPSVNFKEMVRTLVAQSLAKQNQEKVA
jgi:GDPmannose 4,6-dehydratase